MLRWHLNFRQISHRFTLSFTNPSFQDLNGSHNNVSIYDNFKSVEVQGWTPLEILIFLHWMCRPTFTTLLGKRRAISHLMAVLKNRGKCKLATISLHRGDTLSASGPPELVPSNTVPSTMLVNVLKISSHDVFGSLNHIPNTPSQWMVYTWADVTFLLCKYLWPRGHFPKEVRDKINITFFSQKSFKVLISKDWVNGVCGITRTWKGE